MNQASIRPGDSDQCAERRPGRTTGFGAGRLPCVEDAGHDGPHRDAFNRTWAETDVPEGPHAETARQAGRYSVAPEIPLECGERALDASGMPRVCVKDSGHDGDHADARADAWERPERTLERLIAQWGHLYTIARAGALWKAVARNPHASWRTHIEPTPDQIEARMRTHAPQEEATMSPEDRPLTAEEQAAVARQGDYIAWQTATEDRIEDRPPSPVRRSGKV